MSIQTEGIESQALVATARWQRDVDKAAGVNCTSPIKNIGSRRRLQPLLCLKLLPEEWFQVANTLSAYAEHQTVEDRPLPEIAEVALGIVAVLRQQMDTFIELQGLDTQIEAFAAQLPESLPASFV